MGFPPICCKYVLFPLVNKEAAWAYGRAEYKQAGNRSRDEGGKKMESERCHVAAEVERCQNLIGTLQLCEDTQINRNGLI